MAKAIDLQRIRKEVNSRVDATMTKTEILDALGHALWEIGILWDKIEGVDPDKGPPSRLGTSNHHSMTYKLRKVARYSYP